MDSARPPRTVVSAMYAGNIEPIGPQQAPTGIFKKPIGEPWIIDAAGLAGDRQGDAKHHGGPEKAIHHYPAEHYAAWRSARYNLQAESLCPPAFGENLCPSGLTERNVCVGDIYRFGTALLQVSQGRQPCWKLNVKFGRRNMALLLQQTGRIGWYYRVLEPGRAGAGSTLDVIDRPLPEWTVARLGRIIASGILLRSELRAMAELPHLAPSWRNIARRRLASGRIESWSLRLSGSAES